MTPTSDDEPTTEVDPIEALRSANPVPAGSTSRAHQTAAAQALFEEITMTDPHSTPAARLDRRSPSPTRRRAWKAVGAAAVAAGLVFGGVALRPQSGNSAAAEVLDAAEATAGVASGTVELHLVGAVDGEDLDIVVTTRFHGDDVELHFSGGATDAGAQFSVDQTIRVVDGTSYLRSGQLGDGWYAGLDEGVGAEAVLESMGLPVSLSVPSGAGLVDLLSEADDFTEVGENRFRATTTVGAARALAELPAGLAMFTEDAAHLADDEPLDILVTLDGDGYVSRLVVTVDGVDATGASVAVTVTTSYSDLGSGAPIEAPDEVSELPYPPLDDPALTAALGVLDDLEQRRPGLCTDVLITDEEAEPSVEDYVSCLRDAGEPDAADAFRTLLEYGDGADGMTVAEDEPADS